MFPRGGLAVQGHEHLFWGDTSLHYDFRGNSILECIYWNLLYYTLKGMNSSQLMAHEPHASYDSHEWSSISLYVTSVTSEVIKLEWWQTVSLADPWNSICGKQTFSPISPGRVTQESVEEVACIAFSFKDNWAGEALWFHFSQHCHPSWGSTWLKDTEAEAQAPLTNKCHGPNRNWGIVSE